MAKKNSGKLTRDQSRMKTQNVIFVILGVIVILSMIISIIR